jgi:phosphate transport system substrate-binding protein
MFRQLFLVFLILFSSQSFSADDLNWVGCGITRKAFMKSLAEAYEQKTGIHIEIHGGGATRGIRDVAALKAEIGGSCRYKIDNSSEEKSAMLDPVAWDALVVIVHKNNPVNNITMKQIHDIYQGKITNWKELGGNSAPIEVFARKGKISGVGRALRKLVFANYDENFAATQFFKSSGPLEKGIEGNSINAIGVTGISSARKRDVKILKLDGMDPTPENIRNGSYTLYRPLYLIYNPDNERTKDVKDFLSFAHSREGKEIIRKNQVVPYSDALVLVMKQLEQERAARELGLYEQ